MDQENCAKSGGQSQDENDKFWEEEKKIKVSTHLQLVTHTFIDQINISKISNHSQHV